MSEINKQMEIRDLVDNTHMKEKLQDLKNWEKTMKNAEKEIKRQVFTFNSFCEISNHPSLFFLICLGTRRATTNTQSIVEGE